MTPRTAVVTSAAIGFLAAVLITIVLGVPVPQIHDEAAYILQADTFAQGRLTNPPHVLPEHFETFYVLQRPTYQAKYQPGQAVMLAIGQIAGLRIAGAWLAAALACACVTWMLLAWLPLPWAVAGGLISALHPTPLAWAHSYWGGSLAVAGGALVLGGARRLLDAPSTRASILLGAGVVILANTRPFEGAVLCGALVVIALASRRLSFRAIVPAAFVVAAGLAFNLYYDFRVASHPLKLPYVEYEQQYAVTPAFIFQSIQPTAVRHADMRRLTTDWALFYYRDQHSIGGFLGALPRKFATFCNAAFQMVPDAMLVRVADPTSSMLLSLGAIAIEMALLAPFAWLGLACRRDVTLRSAAYVLAAMFFIALSPVVVPLPHYAAPAMPLILLLWLASLRETRGRRAFAAFATIAAAASVALWIRESRLVPWRWPEVGERLEIAKRVEAQPGNHLILVRYTKQHHDHFTWIQNFADIDAQRIVWARDLGDDSALMRYYASRTVWLVIAGDRQPQLILVATPRQQKAAGFRAVPVSGPMS